ncbi:hypothetical protein HAX54_005203 [Datura stramonium]|uniref:Uncharacterized protein n=1 Tax=Datura stramonium TaxID=4076 RepID=A0ABS8T935_DATST|nr:hypothetical protein [Datura stramonium]
MGGDPAAAVLDFADEIKEMRTLVLLGPQIQNSRELSFCVSGIESGIVLSSIPFVKLTTVSGIVPPKIFSSCPGFEGTFKEYISKIVPSFRAGALTCSVED